MPTPLVGIIMGSKSDWDTMQHAAQMLRELGVPYEAKVMSAHRTPDVVLDYAASAQQRGMKVIIAGAGGAAHLAGVVASKTTLPILGVPIQSKALQGLDSLLSIVQMPAGIPVGTLAIGQAGATNAALLAAAILATADTALSQRLQLYRQELARKVLDAKLDDAAAPSS
ncbi:MAG: 5-(carboxyamino)imidazole ribonucleotide mutase [Planctomycetes bacterium]|nr:5-(carboxyamino)imidazole ribonucleotide mutase [Planctomycetota bacterium]